MKTSTKITHKENVSNLTVLYTRVSMFGESYKPSNPLLTVASMTATAIKGQNANANVDVTEVKLKNERAARSSSFYSAYPLVDRSINALKISGASEQTIDQAKAIARDIHGRRASEIMKTDSVNTNSSKQVVKHISDFLTRAHNVNTYALFINSVLEYNPNETDISKAALTAKGVELDTKNADMLTAETENDNAMQLRNAVLYHNDDNLVDVAQNVKLYVKSVFGASSVQYKQISGLMFRKLA